MGEKFFVGIDLGTTNTLVTYKNNKGKLTALKFKDSGNVLPSVLYLYPENEKIVIGGDAVREGNLNPKNKIRSAKKYMGRDKTYELFVESGKNVVLTPTDVAAEVLKAAKAQLTKKLKLSEDDEICAVITVPAAFSGIQKEETTKAAEKAGLTCLGLRPEPVAAAIEGAEGIGENSMIFVVDIGGGTYDTAVVGIHNDNPVIISQEGDRELGGDDFDKVITDYLVEKVSDDLGCDLSSLEKSNMPQDEYRKIISEIEDRAKSAKEQLSNVEEYQARFEGLTIPGYNNNEPVHLSYRITRKKFNSLCSGIYKRIEDRLDKSLTAYKKTGHKMSEITHLVLVGGTCYIPAIIELCERKIGITSSMKCDKTTAVAMGAGKIACNWTALGKNINGMVAQSMGVKVEGDKFSKIIKKGAKYPCKEAAPFTTIYDNQDSVIIEVYYASPDKEDFESILEHEYYGYFTLDNIQQAKAGVPQIEVTFDFDSNEQLTVTAEDLSTRSTKTLIVDRNHITPKSEGRNKPMAIDLLIDCSASMAGEAIADAKNACRKMINEVVDLSLDQIGITSFNIVSRTICPLSSDKNLLLKCVDKMAAYGWTDMQDGIESSRNKLLSSNIRDKIIILMTDGEPNSGERPELLSERIRLEYNIKLAAIFIGEPFSNGCRVAKNIAFSNTLDGEDPLFYTAKSMSELGAIFKKVYGEITRIK